MPAIGILKAARNFYRKLVPAKKQPPVTVRDDRSASKGKLSKDKRKKLELLCEQLFANEALMATGKFHFIGLGKIKSKLGKSWVGQKPIVYDVVEQAIQKFTSKGDMHFRYKEDIYVVVFPAVEPEIGKARALLISEDIRQQLFDHNDQELQDIASDQIVEIDAYLRARDASQNPDIVQSSSYNLLKPKPKPEQQPNIGATIEVDPNSKKPVVAGKAGIPKAPKVPDTNQITDPEAINYTYVPLWNVKFNALTSYICLAQQHSTMSDDPFDSHEAVYFGASPSIKCNLDLRVLRTVANQLMDLNAHGKKLQIVCPVHYDTLVKRSSHDQYILGCQKIPDDHKRQLIFLVIGIPEQIHASNMGKFFGALKSHCNAIHAQVSLRSQIDFNIFSNSHFSAVGVRLKRAKGSEKQLIKTLTTFGEIAKKGMIRQVFALDVPSLSITTSIVCSGFDFLGGPAIHASVDIPDNIYRFAYEDLFKDLLAS
jgi:hypothetical protein